MKKLFAVLFALCTMLSVCLPGHAGPGRPSFSARPSYTGGFRSSGVSPSYRSFSSSPSRSFTYKVSAPSTPAPAAASRTYSAPVTARPISRSTTVNHHYTGGGSSGLSMTEALLLHQALTSSTAASSGGSSSTGGSYSTYSRSSPATSQSVSQADDEAGWAVAPLIGLGLVIILGGALLLHLATRKDKPSEPYPSRGYQPLR